MKRLLFFFTENTNYHYDFAGTKGRNMAPGPEGGFVFIPAKSQSSTNLRLTRSAAPRTALKPSVLQGALPLANGISGKCGRQNYARPGGPPSQLRMCHFLAPKPLELLRAAQKPQWAREPPQTAFAAEKAVLPAVSSDTKPGHALAASVRQRLRKPFCG